MTWHLETSCYKHFSSSLFPFMLLISVKIIQTVCHLSSSRSSFLLCFSILCVSVTRWTSRRKCRHSHAQTPIVLSAALPMWRTLPWSPLYEPLSFKLLAGIILSTNQWLSAQPQQHPPLHPPRSPPCSTAPRHSTLSRGELPCGATHCSACTLCWSQQQQ